MNTGCIVLLVLEAVFYGYIFMMLAILLIDKLKKHLIRRRLQSYVYKHNRKRRNNHE